MVYSASSIMAELKFKSQYPLRVPAGVPGRVPALLVFMFMKRMHYRKLQQSTIAFSALGDHAGSPACRVLH